VKITQIEHIYDNTADFRKSETDLLTDIFTMVWYIRLVIAISR